MVMDKVTTDVQSPIGSAALRKEAGQLGLLHPLVTLLVLVRATRQYPILQRRAPIRAQRTRASLPSRQMESKGMASASKFSFLTPGSRCW